MLTISPECQFCIVQWVYQRISPHVPEGMRSYLQDMINQAVGSRVFATTNIGLLCNRAVFATHELRRSASSYFEAFKQRSNEHARELLHLAENYIADGNTERQKFERASILAAASNVAPLAAPSGVFTFQEVLDIIEGKLHPLIIGDVYQAVLRSGRVLYVTDNAGEVAFDMLLIKAIKEKGAYVTLVVKDDTFFEDVTLSDARYFNLEQIVDEILVSKGFFIRGEASSVLNRAYAMSDLVISKGTGSFEAFRSEALEKETLFMLKAKCRPISRDMEVEEGQIVVRLEGRG